MRTHLWAGAMLPILLLVLVTGCTAQNNPGLTKSQLIELVRVPHINQGDVWYYFASWRNGGTVVKIHFDGDRVLFAESKQEESLEPYYPLLIESIKDWETRSAQRAHWLLFMDWRTEFPHGYYYTIYNRHPTDDSTDGLYIGTPFYSDQVTETTHEEWKKFLAQPPPDLMLPERK